MCVGLTKSQFLGCVLHIYLHVFQVLLIFVVFTWPSIVGGMLVMSCDDRGEMPLSEEWREILESHWVRNDGGIFQCVFIPRCNMVGYLKTGYPWPWISLTATECFKQACFELTSTFTIYNLLYFHIICTQSVFFLMFGIWYGPSPYQKSHGHVSLRQVAS